MKMDVQVMKEGASQGGITLYFSRMQTDVPVKMDFPFLPNINVSHCLRSSNR